MSSFSLSRSRNYWWRLWGVQSVSLQEDLFPLGRAEVESRQQGAGAGVLEVKGVQGKGFEEEGGEKGEWRGGPNDRTGKPTREGGERRDTEERH